MKTIYLLAAGLFFIFSACSEKPKTAAENGVEIPVKLANIEKVIIALPVQISGTVASETEARLSFKTGGIIKSMLVEEGDEVKTGQLLAALDLTEIDAQLSQAKQNVDKLQRDLERVKKLYADTAATLEQLQNLTTAFDVAQNGYEVAKFNRKYSEIRATCNGRIIKKMVNEGDLTTPGTTVFFISGNTAADWIVKTAVSDKDWARISMGDKAEIALDAYPEVNFSGKVFRMAESADLLSGLYQVEIKVDPQGKKLASGLFAQVQINLSEKTRVTMVPIESVVEGEGKNAFVYRPGKDKKTVEKLPVRISSLDNEHAYVLSGLENTEQVIAEGSAYLTPNSRIKLMN